MEAERKHTGKHMLCVINLNFESVSLKQIHTNLQYLPDLQDECECGEMRAAAHGEICVGERDPATFD